MLRTIFKNLWNRRGRNAWLFIELIIVTVLCWYVLDPAIVAYVDSRLPLGYDADRLVELKMRTYPETAPEYNSELTDSASQAQAFWSIMGRIRAHKDVERATVTNDGTNLHGQMTVKNNYRPMLPHDTIVDGVLTTAYIAGVDYFETFGIEVVEGENLSDQPAPRRQGIVITKSLAEAYWPGEKALGKYMRDVDENGDTVNTERVIGVVKDIRYTVNRRSADVAFVSWQQYVRFPWDEFSFIVRVKPGANLNAFKREIQNNIADYSAGNYYVSTVTTYPEIIADYEQSIGSSALRRDAIWVAVFFLVNLFLGVVGSFMLQSKQRIPEFGVHRSFGATRGKVVAILLGEATVLATVAFVIGEIIFLQYALHNGLSTGAINNWAERHLDVWQSHFASHFAVVSAVVYVILLVCVVIGCLIPAWKVARVEPVEALRDE